MGGRGRHWKGRGVVGKGVGLLHPFHGTARRMVLWFCLGKHGAVRGRGSRRTVVTMANVAGLKGAGSPARLVDDTLVCGRLWAGAGEGLGDDTESVWAWLCKGGEVGLGRGLAWRHP